jgi:Zn-dependent peptidase ImmA (M78 family)/transcriptional regulator with XRE-family HTH domain
LRFLPDDKAVNMQFQGDRLRLARELAGSTQASLAAQVGLTSAALSQFESGSTKPTEANLIKIADALHVPPAFFSRVLVETHEGFFRSLRRSSVTDRRRARALGHLAHDLAVRAHAAGEFPETSVPMYPGVQVETGPDAIEVFAAALRTTWGVGPGPAPDVVQLLETHGVAVVRLPLGSADVDAFSLPFPDHPVVVLGADKNDRARSRFDATHELGHLVLHGEQIWGLPQIEKQAHSFAAAFLMPASDIRDELPRTLDWPALFELKMRWQVSLAALLMRAKTLGRMNENTYLSAMKAISARGWRKVEPIPLGQPEQPRLLSRYMAQHRAEISDLPGPLIDSMMAATLQG